MQTGGKTLIVITGPTASGKTSLAVELALRLGCDVISADSRQVFRDIPIGTATPTTEEMRGVTHHGIAMLELGDYYSAAQFEADTMRLLHNLFATCDVEIMCGGSMLYVNAVTRGIDDIPTIEPAIRQKAYGLLETEGLEAVMARLQKLDPEYCRKADLNNHKRLVHALEICMQAGVPYSSLLTGNAKQRPFRVLKFALDWPREELFERINRRVELMLEAGLVEEARRVYDLRHLNSLNTVGYKELFDYFEGRWDLATATARIQKNTRVFAKKQLTWLKRDHEVIWLDPRANNLVDQIVGRLHTPIS